MFEALGHFENVHPPTRLERFVPEYFDQWVDYARDEQRRQNSSKNEETITTFEGFGKTDDAAWTQWTEYVDRKILDYEREAEEEIDEEED